MLGSLNHYKNPCPEVIETALKEIPGAPEIVDNQTPRDFITKTCPCPWKCGTTLTFTDNAFGINANKIRYPKGLSAVVNHLKKDCSKTAV